MIDNLHAYLTGKGYELPASDEFAARLEREISGVWQEAKLTWAGARFADALQRLFIAFQLPTDEIDLDEVMRVYEWRPMPGVVPFPDVHQMLDQLQAQSYKLGLVTNSFLPMWMRDVELVEYDLLDYFEARITSGDTGYMKPHPAIYQRMLALLDTPADRAVFVGDRPENDIAGANEAGLISVLMAPAHLQRDLNGVEPDYTIASLSELPPLLAELEAGAARLTHPSRRSPVETVRESL
jgi:HAD superfamily hydrolase (TIGR01509 family)